MSRGRAVVIGLARSGSAVARALDADGYDVLVVDSADNEPVRERARQLPSRVRVQLGGYDNDVAQGAVIVCPSPGVPWDAPALERARDLGIPVRSEIALVFERCRAHVIGITGTNGKTTTTALVAAILDRGGMRVHLGGNIGVPMLDRLKDVRDDDWVVLELSSFQIETVEEPRCDIACVLNVTPDHLDRHGSFARYAAIKERVIRYARSTAVLGWDDPITRAMAEVAPAPVRWFGASLPDGAEGATVHGDQIVSIDASAATNVVPVRDIPLFGAHNVLNVLAAVAVSHAAGVAPRGIADGVRGFRAVPHRLQTVREDDGVLWVNDSKATNTDSALMALRAFGDRPIVWIGGGRGMEAPVNTLASAVVERARHAVLNGETAQELDAALARLGYSARTVVATLDDAVEAAARIAVRGDVVLLAPGFKSFDQFHDYEERGDRFMALVQARVGSATESS